MKNKKIITKVLVVLAACFMFASFSPSLDGRAVVVDPGVFPQGLFAKTVGYLPGDIISVANITGETTVDLLVIGALDPSEGVAIMLSPEAADAIGIDKNANNIVKITKRSGQDERVYGTAIIAKQGSVSSEKEAVVEENYEEEIAEPAKEAFVEDIPEETEDFEEETVAEEEPVQNNSVLEETEEEAELEEESAEEEVDEELEEEAEPEEELEEESVEEETEEPEEEIAEEFVEEETEDFEEELEEEAVEEDEEEPEEELIEESVDESDAEIEEEIEEEFDEEAAEEESELPEEEIAEEFVEEDEEETEDETIEEIAEPFEEETDEEAVEEELLEEEVIEDVPALPYEEPVEAKVEDDIEEAEVADEEDEIDVVIESELEEYEETEEEYEAIVLVPAESVPPVNEYVDEDEVESCEEDTVDEVEEFDETDEDAPIIIQPIPAENNAPVAVETEKEEVKEEIKVEEPKTAASYEKYMVGSLADLKSGKYYIQIAALSQDENIMEIVNKYGNNYPITIVPMAGGVRKQVLIGPLSMDEYAVVLARFKSYGYKDAFLRKIK